MSEKLLEIKGVSKSFPGVKALENIDIDLCRGEVHVILGENGAGKSTLMKILSGAYQADEGQLFVEGTEITHNSPKVSESFGIRMIYQELNLVEELSVAQNIFLGKEKYKGAALDTKEMNAKAQQMMADMNIQIDPTELIKNLGVGTQQMVEICKALSTNARILVFDEPTSSLTDSEIVELFRIIRILKKQGVGMFYISHRLEELKEIGDRVTIMRDGKKILTTDADKISMNEIIEGIAGRKIENLYPHTRKEPGECLLDVKGLCGERFRNINIKVCAGEIVGVSGLVGAGRTEVARALMGIDKRISGVALLEGKALPKHNIQKVVDMGLCLLPENRKTEGLALSLSIRENTVVSSLNKLFPSRIISGKKETVAVNRYVKDLNIATSSIEKLVQFLSGGTQQKVVVAKWLMSQSKVFIFDEPTRGIDVGAKSEIYRLMDELTEQGAGILMISSDLPEVLGMSDRIYVMAQGDLVGELDASQASQQEILRMAFKQHQVQEVS